MPIGVGAVCNSTIVAEEYLYFGAIGEQIIYEKRDAYFHEALFLCCEVVCGTERDVFFCR